MNTLRIIFEIVIILCIVFITVGGRYESLGDILKLLKRLIVLFTMYTVEKIVLLPFTPDNNMNIRIVAIVTLLLFLVLLIMTRIKILKEYNRRIKER